MRLRPLLAAAATLLAGACDLPLELSAGDSLEIQVSRSSIRLENNLAEPVYTFLIERQAAALTDWIACSVPDECDGIAPGRSRRVDYRDIVGYDRGDREAIVYWWVLVPDPGGGHRVDGFRSRVVRLAGY